MTMFLLGLIYVVFFVVLAQAFNLGLIPIILIGGGLLFAQYWTSDKIALASSGAKIVSQAEAPELHAVIQRLCMTAGLPMPRVAIVPTDMPNAFATGRSPKHAAVAVTQGLLDRLEPHELEGVIAHELSHVAHRDVAVMTLASFFAMVAGFITRWGFFFGGGFGGGDDDNNSGNAFVRRAARLDHRLRPLVRPHPHALALSRVRGRPGRRDPHQVAVEPGVGARQDLGRDGPDPAA